MSTALLAGCGQKKAAETVNENAETEKEGNASGEAATEGSEGDGQDAASSEEIEEPAITVGVLLPGEEEPKDTDAEEFSSAFALKNIGASICYAGNDPEVQLEQMEELIDAGVTTFAIDPVDPYGFTEALAKDRDEKLTVLSYDDLIMDTDQISYYVTYDYRAMGHQMADRIIKDFDLEKRDDTQEPLTIEFFMGSLDDSQALFYFNGIMENLQPYLDAGTLVCRSDRLDFQCAGILRADADQTGKLLEDLMEEFYEGEAPDILVTGFDEAACALIDTLEDKELLPGSEDWPYITGLGCEAEAVKRIAEGRMNCSLFMARGNLVEKCVDLLSECLDGGSPEVDNYEQYDNGVKIIGTNTCDAQMIDADNYELLIDNGSYEAWEIEPEMTFTTEEAESADGTTKEEDASEEAELSEASEADSAEEDTEAVEETEEQTVSGEESVEESDEDKEESEEEEKKSFSILSGKSKA
jgi:putative multiple sugar transport system substrate-binding protein